MHQPAPGSRRRVEEHVQPISSLPAKNKGALWRPLNDELAKRFNGASSLARTLMPRGTVSSRTSNSYSYSA
jgi:hypothetical protein